MALPSERREHPRIPLALAVRYPDGDAFLDDWTENVSAGGLFVQSEARHGIGDRIQLEVRFPGLLEPVRIAGTVTWVREAEDGQRPGFGLEVQSEGQRRRLAELALMATRTHQRQEDFRVLVVEDNESVSDMYERVMQRVQHITDGRVITELAGNGLEAKQKLERFRPDLIVTDLYMPVMDGVELCRFVKSRAELRDTPLLVITAGAEDEREVVEGLGVDACLQKPVQFGQILETIARLLWLRGRTDGEEREKGREGGETPG